MATGYEKINAIKNKLKVKQTVNDLARLMNCGPRTIFRHLEVIGEENCGLRKFKENGDAILINYQYGDSYMFEIIRITCSLK